jgi:hypothetical protein
VTGRQRAYFLVRGAAVVAFVLSWSVMPPGNGAAAVAIGAGVVGVLTCLGVNAGGPGERAGARLEQQRWLAVRAPQGDWPPYDEDRVVDGEVVSEGPLSPPGPPAG